jgi:7-cyano-7-deazaguanine synthase
MDTIDGVLLASGGMDSTVMAYWLQNKNINVIPLFLDYNQHCVQKEYETLKEVLPRKLSDNIKILKIGDVYRDSSSRLIKEANLWTDNVVAEDLYLPYRNLLFLSIAAAYAQSKGIKAVYTAFINSNHAKEIDCSLDFFIKLGTLVSEYGSVTIEMPFREMSKYQVAKLGIQLGVPIEKTYSCQTNSKNHCGACPNCVDRLEAINSIFEEAN